MMSQALLCPTEHIGSRGYAILSQQTNACAIAKFLRHSQIPNSFATFAFSFLLVPISGMVRIQKLVNLTAV